MDKKPSRKIEILETTRDLIFSEGFGNFTTRAVAKRIGITEAAIYKHYSSKESLLLHLLESLFQPWQKALKKLVDEPGRAPEKLVRLAGIHLDFLLEKKLNPLLFFSEAIKPENSKILQILQTNLNYLRLRVCDILEQGITEKSIKPDIQISPASICIVGAIQAGVIKWTVFQTSKNLKSETKANIRFILDQITCTGSDQNVD